jgi:hypothetical protein
MLRPGARHYRIDGDLLDGVFHPSLFFGRDGHLADNFIRRMTRSREHFSHSLFCGKNDRQSVRPAVFIKEPAEIVFSIRLQQSRLF